MDSNVLLDYLDQDSEWFDWSALMLSAVAEDGHLAINPVIYAEVSVGFERIEDVEMALPRSYFVSDGPPLGSRIPCRPHVSGVSAQRWGEEIAAA